MSRCYSLTHVHNLFISEIIEKVQNGDEKIYRPEVDDHEASNDFLALMETCWHQNPTARPSFSSIKNSLKKMDKGT